MKKQWITALQTKDIWTDYNDNPIIFINALSLALGGSFTVLQNYILSFVEQRPKWRYFILQETIDENLTFGDIGPNVCILYCGEKRMSYVGRYLWEKKWLGNVCKSLGVNIYFGPNGVYHPNVKIPQCLLIQDPAPFILKARSLKIALRHILLRKRWSDGVKHAACMGYTSNYMRSLVVKNASQEKGKYIIAYNGIDQSMRETANKPFRPFAEREPFILSVSTINKHKNFETLIRALSILRKKPGFERYRLKIMGRLLNKKYYEYLREEVKKYGLCEAVTFQLDCLWKDIACAYETASLFSLTSLCESFGIATLEAMAHGTPVVAGASTAIPEICGNAAALVPPDDSQTLADAWANVLGNESKYIELQNAGRYRCLEFDWQKTVAKWIEFFESILD